MNERLNMYKQMGNVNQLSSDMMNGRTSEPEKPSMTDYFISSLTNRTSNLSKCKA